jgi:hypothetical protein
MAQLIVAMVGVLGSSVAAIFTFWQARQAARDEQDVTHPSITDKIDILHATLERSGSLIGEIQAEFKLQVAALDRIKAETDENQRLAALTKDQADAVRGVIEQAQTKGARRGNRAQWGFFAAGLLACSPQFRLGSRELRVRHVFQVGNRLSGPVATYTNRVITMHV